LDISKWKEKTEKFRDIVFEIYFFFSVIYKWNYLNKIALIDSDNQLNFNHKYKLRIISVETGSFI